MLIPGLIREVRGKKLLWWLLGIGLSSGGVAVGQAYFFAGVIDAVFIGRKGLASVLPGLGILSLLIVLRSALVWAAERLGFHMAAEIRADLRQRLLRKIFAVGPLTMGKEQTGEIVTTLGEGLDSLEPYFARYLPQLVTAVLVPLLILVTVVGQDGVSALILLITAPLMPVFMNLIGNWAKRLSIRRWDVLSRLSTHFFDILQGLTTLKLFGRSGEQASIVYDVSENFRKSTLEVMRVAFLSALVLELLATVSTAIVAVTVGLKLLYGNLGFREAFFILLLAPEYYLPFRLLSSHFHSSLTAKAVSEKIARLLSLTVHDEPEEQNERRGDAQGIAIEFMDVTTSYPGRSKPAIANFSFRMEKSETVALVGPSGSGKSTVAKLLLGFLAPAAGDIKVNSTRLSTINRSAWLEKVAYIPQFPHIFSGTVSENIRFGAPGTEEEVLAAAEAAGIDKLVEVLPQGYETLLGEGGIALSGGETQRIALARAFFRKAQLLILDEATAWLDPKAEDKVRESLRKSMKNQTVLIIAHRLSTTINADRVLVLEDGKIVEQGPPGELLAYEGRYHRMMAAFRGFV